MPTRERMVHAGRRRTLESLRRLGRDFRIARVGAGLSLRTVADTTGASHQQLARFERGELRRVVLEDVGAWCATVGLELALRAYPAGDPLRDRAQRALLARLRERIHRTLRWREEVPLPVEGDRRAWDAVVEPPDRSWRLRIEAETSIADAQALERRLALKIRDDPTGHVLLLVADTRANRQAVVALASGIGTALPAPPRSMLRALREGDEPPGSGIVLL